MRRSLRNSVVVIMGATTGIGRAAATAFARRGATVVVSGRSAQILEEVAAECASFGVPSLAVAADVRDECAVRDVARKAFEAFGRIDVWINNAAVVLFALTEDAPYEAYRQVIETNLLGVVHGARAVIPYFRTQGSGVMINNASALGKVGRQYVGSYVAAKFGVVGLSQCLRQELRDQPDIHVCTLLPAAMDTPIFQHGGNYLGRAVQPMPPIYPVQEAALAMVSLAERPRRERYVGLAGRIGVLMHVVAPGLTERVLAKYVERYNFQDRSAPPAPGNIFAPSPLWTRASGGWRTTRGLSALAELARSGLQIALFLPIAALERLGKLPSA